MYIRHKTIKGIKYYYLCECKRVNGKPKQVVLAYLGKHPTVDACIGYHRIFAGTLTKKLALLSDRQTKKRASLEKQRTKSIEKIKELLPIQQRSA